MTILQSKAENYGQLIPIRIVVGFSQAFFNPAAFTLIADTFPKEQVEWINGILSGSNQYQTFGNILVTLMWHIGMWWYSRRLKSKNSS